jgi:hypothetical protein
MRKEGDVMLSRLSTHIMGFLIIMGSLAYYGWAPHPSPTFALTGILIGGFSFLNAQQLALLENLLGKFPLDSVGSGKSSSLAQSAIPSSTGTSGIGSGSSSPNALPHVGT